MDAEKIQTLEQVHDAIDVVENARAISGLTPIERLDLETASVKLRNLERSIIRIKTSEMIGALTADTKGLKDLADQIKQSDERLGGIAHAIEKTAVVIEGFINVVTTAIAAGLF